MKKDDLSFILVSFFLMLMFVNLVSAQDAGVVAGTNNVLDKILGVLDPIVKLLIGDTGGDPAIFFAKFLLLIIVVALVWFPIKFFPGFTGKPGLTFIVSLAVGLLGIRFLSDEIIATITLPYSAFAVAITALLPLILYFIWVEKSLVGRPALRKVAWIFAAVIFVGLFIARYEEIRNISPGGFNPIWYYLIAAGVCIIFMIADKTIQRAWAKAQRQEAFALVNIERKGEFIEKYELVLDHWEKNRISTEEANKQIKNIQRKAKNYNLSYDMFPKVED